MIQAAVRKHVAIALGTLALTAGLAASGCGGDSDAEAEGPVDITKLRADFEERWGELAPGWYRHITAINWVNDKLEIRTDLRGDEAVETLRTVCLEPLKLAFEQQAEPDTIDLTARLVGAGGGGLGGCA